jgi:hypothetical protein
MDRAKQKEIDLTDCISLPQSVIKDCGVNAALLIAYAIKNKTPVSKNASLFNILKMTGYIDDDGNWECKTSSYVAISDRSDFYKSFDTMEWRMEATIFEERVKSRGMSVPGVRDVTYISALSAIRKANEMGWVTLVFDNGQINKKAIRPSSASPISSGGSFSKDNQRQFKDRSKKPSS